MWKKFWVVVIILAVIFGLIYGWHRFVNYKIGQYFKTHQSPPVEVNVSKAKAAIWHDQIPVTGTTVANQGVNITPEASGTIVKLFFKSGGFVKAGAPILELNPNILKAQLANDEANLALSKVTYERQQSLYQQNAAAASDLDKAKAKYQEDIATVNQTKAQLAQTLVTAPFSGRLGIRQVDLGQYLNPGDTIVNLQSLDPMFVDFTVPENNMAFLKVGQPVRLQNNAFPNKTFQGKIVAMASALSNDTRNLQVRALVNNHQNQLVSGMFMNGDVILPKVNHVILIPQVSITYSQVGDYVFVIKNDKAIKTYITLGERRNDVVAVTKGLTAGDQVVYAGQLKLRNGIAVKVVPPKIVQQTEKNAQMAVKKTKLNLVKSSHLEHKAA